MYHFFVSPECVGEKLITITGADVNHIVNVLRMKAGEEIMAVDGSGSEYYCMIESMDTEQVSARICYKRECEQELPVHITLYQGLPKSDKLELIIQKCVELGISRIVPVNMKRSVVKIEDKKVESRVKRWQGISEAAAKQSGRGIIPEVCAPVSFKNAMQEASGATVKLFPYEMAGKTCPMELTRQKLAAIKPGDSVAVFIGPEGGFDDSEVELAGEFGYEPITLGKRILRTETAGLYVLSVLGYLLER
ncbi:MAG: 16S rRNA (uracil(1498)-N(3))-methyltransferase [Lachnospiraceae bacterium]|nr:16S rRNA (uracil(1498)-N(3))-methyltransferase [Lachnospiraceae bacterium]